MSFSTAYQRRLQAPGISIVENSDDTVSQTRARDETIADSTTDAQIDFEVDISELRAFGMVASVAMTVKTNSAGSPQETFTLAAGKPVFWVVGETAIFAGDVTSVFVTNASGDDGQLKLLAAEGTG